MQIYLIPFISALIGWFTNYIAVKMLFHPKKPISILGIKFQGLIPQRKHDLADRIGELVSSELISHEDIIRILNKTSQRESIQELISSKIDEFLSEKLLSINPMFGMFLSGPVLEKIKQLLLDEIVFMIPVLVDKLTENLEEDINYKEIVKQKINDFDLDTLESIVYKIADKELKHIEFYGAILGFFIGIVQLLLIKVVVI